MKFKILANQLRDVVTRLNSVVDKKNSRPILTNFLFKLTPNKLEVLATDLEVSAKIVVPVHAVDSGEFCVSSKNIGDILRELPNQEIVIEIDKTKNLLNLTCDEIKYALIISNTDDFPHLAFENSNDHIKIPSEEISKIITKTSFAMSNDETRLFLNGIFLQQLNNKLRAVAIDGHRLALIDIDFEDNQYKNLIQGVIIPKKGIFELKKLIEVYSNSKLDISFDESFLYTKIENYYLSIRLISREYLKYQTVIPSKTLLKLSVEKALILDAVKRIKILSNEQTNGIRFIAQNNKIELFSSNSNLGYAQETLLAEYSGDKIEIGFNAKYLIDALSVIDGDKVILEFTNSLSPTVIKCPAMPNFLSIIMPLRI